MIRLLYNVIITLSVINKYQKHPLIYQLFILCFLYLFLYKILIPRVLAFGCFDDCFAITSGYFISNGKKLYTDIFYNHQLILPYLSSLIQLYFKPQNLYELILRHREVMLGLSFILNSLLLVRFGGKMLIWAIFFELSKFYFFGDRFLAEGIVVYPIIYLALLTIEKVKYKKLFKFDYIVSGIFAYLVFFMREPYIPLTLFLLFAVFYGKENIRVKILTFIFLTVISLLTLSLFNLTDIFYALYKFNQITIISGEYAQSHLQGIGILRIFLYPFLIFFDGKWNFIHIYLTSGVSILFLLIAIYFYNTKKNILPILFFLSLGLATIRYVSPDQIYFESYRLLIWHGLLLAFILSMIFILKYKYKIVFYLLSIFTLFWVSILINKDSYLLHKPDPQFDLLTNYGRIMQVGETVKKISNKNDTFFSDGADELTHWSTGLPSSYRYSMYSAQMPQIEKFRIERNNMFLKNPPDFYYDFCLTNNRPKYSLGEFLKLYSNLNLYNNPSCLFVRKAKLPEITDIQWGKIKEWGFEKPPSI